jgi:hypothetical protein
MKNKIIVLTSILLSCLSVIGQVSLPRELVIIADGNAANYTALVVVQEVTDFRAWYRSFIMDRQINEAMGLSGPSFARDMLDSNRILTYYTVTNMHKARGFVHSELMKEMMQKAGVHQLPEISFINVQYDLNVIMQPERLFITMHVKDYEAWQKAFYGEDKAIRKSSGLVDRLVARDPDDSNLITVYFGLTDMVKAKAYVASPDFKRVYAPAGLDHAPQISWYRWCNYSGWYAVDASIK